MAPGPQAGPGPPDGGATRRVALLCWLAYAALALSAVWTVPFPNNYDELAHLSYLTRLAQMPLDQLDFSALRLLRPGLEPGFGAEGNYLNHPPGYYLALGWLLPADHWPTLHTVHLLRLVNAGLSILAVGAALLVGVLRRLEPRLMLLFGAMVVLVPVLQVTGSGISNDNLALLGGCMAVLGAQAMRNGRRPGAVLLLAGCAAATLAKFTAALMMGGFAGVFLLLQAGPWRRVPMLAALAAVEAMAGLPYAWFVLRFGTPVPITPAFAAVGAEAAAARLTLHGWVPGAVLSLPAYAVQFLRWLFDSWNPVASLGAGAEAAVLLAPALALLAAVPALVANAPGRRGADAVLAASGAALLLTLVPHLVFSWQRYHLALGAPPFDAVPRYYLPCALAAVPAAACRTVQRVPGSWRGVAVWVMLLAVVAGLPILAACSGHACP